MPLFRAHLCTSFHAQIFLSSAVLSMIYPLLPQQYLPLRSNTPTTGFTISLKSSWSLTTPPYQPSRRAVLDMRAFTPSTNAKIANIGKQTIRNRSTAGALPKSSKRRTPTIRHRHKNPRRPIPRATRDVNQRLATGTTPAPDQATRDVLRHTGTPPAPYQGFKLCRNHPPSSRASGTIPLSSRVTPANIKSGLYM
jgi:hypothetical protein